MPLLLMCYRSLLYRIRLWMFCRQKSFQRDRWFRAAEVIHDTVTRNAKEPGTSRLRRPHIGKMCPCLLEHLRSQVFCNFRGADEKAQKPQDTWIVSLVERFKARPLISDSSECFTLLILP